jgi:SAM-dependent methyltransferase
MPKPCYTVNRDTFCTVMHPNNTVPWRMTVLAAPEATVAEFYDDLAPFYHLIYPDWEASITRQAVALDAVVRERRPGASTVLDAACGIGTQALGLAALGYSVTASDLSAASVERARTEASRRGLEIAFSVGDMRQAWADHRRRFDVVLACDNSVAHLLTDAEIGRAMREFYHCTQAGGLCLISLRDYDLVEKVGTQVTPCGVRHEGVSRYLLWQVWEFEEGDAYRQDLYLVEDAGGAECRTRVMRSRSRAVSPDTVAGLMGAAGFEDVRRLDGRYFQPLVVGVRR